MNGEFINLCNSFQFTHRNVSMIRQAMKDRQTCFVIVYLYNNICFVEYYLDAGFPKNEENRCIQEYTLILNK